MLIYFKQLFATIVNNTKRKHTLTVRAILNWLFIIHRGKPVGQRFVEMVSKTSRIGNFVRD